MSISSSPVCQEWFGKRTLKGLVKYFFKKTTFKIGFKKYCNFYTSLTFFWELIWDFWIFMAGNVGHKI